MALPEPERSGSLPMQQEIGVAARNTVKLALSLLCTWSVALYVRFQVPRFMGTAEFGRYTFADGIAASFLGWLELGVELYIQKEVSVRPKHASDFLGALIVARAVLGAVLIAMMFGILRSTGQSKEIQITAFVFSLTYFVTVVNTTFGTILQATTRVGRLALANVITKVAWGIGLVGCIWLKQPMAYFAGALLGAELLRSLMLLPAARSAVDLKFRVDMRAFWKVFVASLPYFISGAAIIITGRVNVTMLEYLVKDEREVGWLGASNNIGTLSMIMTPVLSGILLPTLARARAHSQKEVYKLLQVALEAVLVVAIPVTLLIGIGADIWVRAAFGRQYAQAAMSLVVTAPQFVFTYTAMTLTLGLVILDKQWKATMNSVLALIITPVFLLIMVPIMSRLGEGGAAMGAATSVAFSEIVISSLCMYYVGRGAVAGRTIAAVIKSIGVAGAVVAFDLLVLRPRGMLLSISRVAIDMLLYGVGVIAVGAVRLKEAWALAKTLKKRRSGEDDG